MSTESPRDLIERPTLSEAWLVALRTLAARGQDPGSPLTVSFTNFDKNGLPIELRAIRECLDRELAKHRKMTVEISAAMIFPFGSLQLLEMRLMRIVSITELAEYYRQRVYPRLRARNRRANGKGTYFLRMINFGADPKDDNSAGENQLAKLLTIWQSNDRIVQSALQVAIRDPKQDLTRNPRPFFPCLQQASFAYGPQNRISVTGYYPTQYIFDRAYGNYLGLAHLGWFVARAMKKRLARVNCICAHPLIGGIGVTRSALRRAFVNVDRHDSS